MPRLLQLAVTLSPGAIPVALPGSLLWFGAALDNIGLSFLRVTLLGPATKRPFNLIDPVSPPCREAPAQRAPARSQCPDPAAMSLLHPATCSLTFLSPGLLCGQGGGQCHIPGGSPWTAKARPCLTRCSFCPGYHRCQDFPCPGHAGRRVWQTADAQLLAFGFRCYETSQSPQV